MNSSVLFLQKRPHRAGAQTCLARLLRHESMRGRQPLVVCSSNGWLTEECRRSDLAYLIEPFPSSRSLAARWFFNGAFAQRVAMQLKTKALSPAIVHANDHWEGLLGRAVARQMGARTAIFLRSPGMTRQDYFKYQCHAYDLVIAVGEELQRRAQSWDPQRAIELIHDGIEAAEFAPPKPKAAGFPTRILVIGSPLDWKGWADLTEALWQLEQAGAMPRLEFDFTGTQPEPAKNDLKLTRLRQSTGRFLGRVEPFRELVLGYDLVINPSRMESFGMAAIEVIAAGVPLLSSRTGVIEQVIGQSEFLFPPRQPGALARGLRNLIQSWPRLGFDTEKCQQRIREKFLITHCAARLGAAYDGLLAAGPRKP
jgi:glycosyltransferase involved in cell wall biosynthesis